MTIRISLATVIVAVIFAAVGAGVTVGVMLWEPWDGGYERRFTGAEAAAFVHVRVNLTLEPDLLRSGVFYFNCGADDFNEDLRAWIVLCKFGKRDEVERAADFTFRFYDESEQIENLIPNLAAGS